MKMRRSRKIALTMAGLLVSSVPCFAQTTNPQVTTKSSTTQGTTNAQGSTNATTQGTTSSSLSVTVALPPTYESTISALSALATSGPAALKTSRANARALAIRTALTKKMLAAGSSVTSIVLDKDNQDPTLGEIALLCTPRQDYIRSSVSLNYLNSFVQNVNAVSAKAAAPTDIAGAIKLLLATSNYSIADKIKVDDKTIDSLSTSTLANCKADLSSYDQDYYGAPIRSAPTLTSATGAASGSGGISSITTFAFLGPVGTLMDTFLSVLQPVLIDASVIVDEARRQAAITAALSDPAIEAKIAATGKQLAGALSAYAAASRHTETALFVEQLTAIRETSIDLSSDAACKNLAPDNRLPSGAPNVAFVNCWHAAWAKLQPMVTTLTSTGDSYDNLADPSTGADPQKLLGTILEDYKKIKNGADAPENLAVFASDVTQFITFANAIATAVSSLETAAPKTAATTPAATGGKK
jgi:hypothetical protein